MFVGTAGDNDKRGYGDYPSGRKTWIKADPTWNGLIQAIKEPAKLILSRRNTAEGGVCLAE